MFKLFFCYLQLQNAVCQPNFDSFSINDVLCDVLLKLPKWFWRKRFAKVVKVLLQVNPLVSVDLVPSSYMYINPFSYALFQWSGDDV